MPKTTTPATENPIERKRRQRVELHAKLKEMHPDVFIVDAVTGRAPGPSASQIAAAQKALGHEPEKEPTATPVAPPREE